jgi:hypothetical protein
MEHICLLSHLQEPATCHYPQPINPVHISTSHFLNISFNITLPPTPRSCKWFFPSGAQPKPTCTSALVHMCYCPTHLILFWFYHLHNVVTITEQTPLLFSLLHYSVIKSLLGPSIIRSTLLSTHSQPSLFPQCERSFTPIHSNKQHNSSVCFNLYIFR